MKARNIRDECRPLSGRDGKVSTRPANNSICLKSELGKCHSRARDLDGRGRLGFLKGPATCNDIVDDIVDDARADAIFATLTNRRRYRYVWYGL